MTSGERLIKCFTGDKTDRVPFGVGIGYHPWGEAHKRWRIETGDPNLDYAKALGYDEGFMSPKVISGIFPGFEREVYEEDENRIYFRDERGILQRARKDAGSIPEYLEYPVKTPDDWLKLKEERLVIGDPARIREDWDAFRAEAGSKGAAVQAGNYPWGVFGSVRDLMGVEELLIAFYTEPEMIKDIMSHLTSLWIALWEAVSAEVRIDHIHIWEDMAGRQGSLISPAMIEEFMMPCYDRVYDFARSKGVRVVSVDSDGDCTELVRVMTKHGVNVFFPFEVQAGSDIVKFREEYPELGIWCGLDKRVLAKDRAAIDAELKRAEKMVGMGRYVPAFDHLIPPDVPWENFAYACERLKNICYGG